MATAPKRKKGNSKELATFLRWVKSNVIGHYIDEFDRKISLQRKSYATTRLVDFKRVIVSTPAMFYARKPAYVIFGQRNFLYLLYKLAITLLHSDSPATFLIFSLLHILFQTEIHLDNA